MLNHYTQTHSYNHQISVNMPAPRGKKRKSEQQSTASNSDHLNALQPAAQIVPSAQYVATKTEDGFPESPNKRRKVNITAEQKQGLINNLQIELADRARKLRSQYNAQIRNLRARIEIRVNRIPPALRKVKLGDLIAKRAAESHTQKTASPPSSNVFKPPPVPQKDYPVAPRPPLQSARPTSSNTSMAPPPRVRRSDIITGGDKENEIAQVDSPKRYQRPATANGRPTTANGRPTALPQVLSPTSSNSRLIRPSERMSPTKSFIARPVSPTKSSVISNLVEKARSTTQAASSRKTTTMSSVSTTSSSAAPTTKTTRTKKTATATTAAATSRAGATSRSTRRVSAVSESSDGSTGTVVRKRTTTAAKPDPPTAAAKRSVMGTIRKGVAGAATKKAAAAKAAPPAATGTGRVLRKRNA